MIQALGFLTTGFWILMIYDCIQREPEKQLWIWILLFVNVPGAIIYFFACWLPRTSIPIPAYFSRWTRRRELWMAEAAARNIGKAHQFVTLGNILRDMGMLHKAEVAYKQALDKDIANTQALWGTACINMQKKNFESAKAHLQTLLKLEPDYKYGEASLAYGKTLLALQDLEAAKLHLEEHLKNWGHPEAYIMMATIKSQLGNSQEARSYLEKMICKVKGSTYYHYKQNRHFVSKAKRLLRTLER